MFLGRDREFAMLRGLFEKPVASLVVCRGRRRIGKSRLIREFGLSAERFLRFQGLPPRDGATEATQLDSFAESLARQTPVPKVRIESWPQAFALLSSQLDNRSTVVLFDEVSWMSSHSPDFAGHLKDAWDTGFSLHAHLVVVICGSVSSWLQNNILNNTAFVGRLTLTLTLGPLSPRYCNEFWGEARDRVSTREKLEFLSVAGGVPRYLEEIRPHDSAATMIHRLCFTKEGFLFSEFDAMWSDLFSRRGPAYRSLVQALADGPKSLEQLSTILGVDKSGRIVDYLTDLELSGFVRKVPRFNLQDGSETARGARYRIVDNYLRFYLTQIAPRRTAIARDRFAATPLDRIVNWDAVLGLQFEALILNHISEVCALLEIDLATVTAADQYFQRATARRRGCQVDLLIQTRHAIWVCEIKCCASIGVGIVEEVKNKALALDISPHRTVRYALIYEAEVSDELRREGFFDRLLPFERILRSS